ncbi:MAG: relaxase/mobilization nuclease domain-containing protein [Lachnospiraceae bacterium]|nr:relaxase/mobilization nuclease domain-containing protein [Lachnospiraceae bacterium]
MGILKANNYSTSHGALNRVIHYVLEENKTPDELLYFDGPYKYDTITPENVYQAFIDEKKLWNKDTGRMYAHYSVAFHRDDNITKEQVLEIGKEVFGRIFDGHQFLLAVHTDRDHLHVHMVANSVSYVDGHKIHTSNSDLERYKEMSNDIFRQHGLHVAQKGYHFDGTPFDDTEVTSWDKNTYNMIANRPQDSFKISCMIALTECRRKARSKEEFTSLMKDKGWEVIWSDSRKYITFVNADGKRIRDKTIAKELNTRIDKETLENEFERNRYSGIEYEAAGNSGEITGGYTSGCNGAASSNESAETYGFGEWPAQGGTGEIVSAVLNTGRRVEEAVNGNETGAGKGDSTDPEVMAKYRGRKQSSDDESEEQYQGIRM